MNTSWILDNLETLGFVSVIVVAILEMIVRRLFPLFYYQYGVPTLRCNALLLSLHKPLQLEDFRFEAVDGKPYVEIRRLNEHEYGLWPSKYKSRSRTRMSNYSPLTRGYISFDEQDSTLKLRVYLNWSATLFFLMWFGVLIAMPPWLIKVLMVVLGGIVVYVLYRGEQEQYLDIWCRACDELG